MGRIRFPPEKIIYPPPKAVGGEAQEGEIIARVTAIQKTDGSGDYCRVLDRIKWSDGGEEIRFTYYYRKEKGSDTDWIYGQGAGHMTPEIFFELIKKAKSKDKKIEPAFGDFGTIFDCIKLD